MAEIKFADIASALETGREIEFAFNGKKYSITNSRGFWVLCCDTDASIVLNTICTSGEKSLLSEKVRSIPIDGVLISEIFDDLKYDVTSLYIL